MPKDMSQIPTNSDLIPSARQQGDAVVVAVRGEIDLHNSPELRGALLDMLARFKPAKLVLNLAQVPYMDSSAIAVLVESLQKLRKSGGKIYLTDLQPRVKGLLEIARLDAIFVIVAEEKDALTK
jgi:anti-sigma B factor antagonist